MAEQQQIAKQKSPGEFRAMASSIAGSLLKDWVGEARAAEATGRISAALAASAASARDPSDFYACTSQSVATCIAISALTGLMPGVGSTALAYVVPQRPRANEAPQLQYMLSHRGLNALAQRSGQTMVAIPIGLKDGVSVNADGEVTITSRDIDNPPLTHDELRGIVIVVKSIETGAVLAREFMPKSLIEKRRAMSRSWSGNGRKYSPWENWPIEMAMKTAMHYAIGRGWCVIDDTEASRALSCEDSDIVEAHVVPAKRIADLLPNDVVSDEQQPQTLAEQIAAATTLDACEAIASRIEAEAKDMPEPMVESLREQLAAKQNQLAK